MQFIKRQMAGTAASPDGQVPEDPAFAKSHPALWEYLSAFCWEDEKPRKLSTMSFSIQEGRWTCCFVDKDSNRLAFLSATSFTELLKSLEKKLATDSMEWRKCKDWRKKT